MENSYPYEPISNTREIRILALNPAETGDVITCVLSRVFLDAEPKYEALSYTWDTDSSTSSQQDLKTINCSGHKMLVKENLFAALRRLRYPDRPRSLWVDAICINQADKEEKNHQVALMGKIYANAREVIIWLGEEEADDALAFDPIIRSERVFKKVAPDSDLLRQVWDSEGRPDEIPMALGNQWRALSGLLKKRWFSRVWIVQEIALARKATLFCGKFTWDWKRFSKALRDIYDSSLRAMMFPYGIPQGIRALFVIMRIIDSRNLQEPLSLFDLLVSTQGFQATDLRDKIFSLLSCLDFTENETEHVKARKAFNLDYNISVDDLFRKVTVYYLLDEGHLEILSLVNHGSRLDEHGNISWLLPRYIPSENLHEPLGVHLRLKQNPAKPLGRYPCNHSHPSHISISGVLVDQIRAVSTIWVRPDKSTSIMKLTFDYCHQMDRYISTCESIYRELVEFSSGSVPDLTADAFWRTLICNTSESFDTPDFEYGRIFTSWRKRLRMLGEFARSGRADWSAIAAENQWLEVFPYDSAIAIWTKHKKFCTTDGNRLGMVPHAAKEGDIICAFQGAVTPFVLRPDGSGNYRLVGECYVHGLMDGKFSDVPGFMEKLEDIVLV